ncbi:hypothetical protein EDD15DRAFT_2384720 [Pisolithus albus]|nr:hypothetical protein EDD15DRAFT_2384720 [Pisolithus albus]
MPSAHHQYPNETLICHGYVGCSPLFPTVAVSLRTLATFRQQQRTCPHFSIQALSRTLCHLHAVPYRHHLTTQLRIAYDAYLEILDGVDKKLNHALNRDRPDWRLLNECPACFYKLDDEPPLEFDWLVSIDGNNSLKRWNPASYGAVPRDDPRVARSDFWLHAADVNRFAHTARPTQARIITVDSTDAAPGDDWIDDDTNAGGASCVNRWRNAGPEQRKKMFAVFDESGIFLASCRHRFALVGCDMVQSGELAKYPLAVLERLLAVYGENGALFYDIGCAFDTTARNSTLGPTMRTLNLRLMVGAFHGHAHNRKCQLDWHPLYVRGTGHTEGEGCEHIFSASNALARNTRHSSKFHRQQAIEQHFAFWNADKYAALGNFLWNHFCSAITELDVLKSKFQLTDADFERFHEQERCYLTNFKGLPAQDQVSIKREWEWAREAANGALTNVCPGRHEEISAALKRARIQVETAYQRLQHAEALAGHIQGQLGIELPWEIGSSEYSQWKEEAKITKYRAALDELERLVVMRLFELAKLGMSGTGYKLRQQIVKALQRRSEAIRNAITHYNKEASALNPPRPNITWKDIVDYSILGEFDLLRQSRADIREADWAKPAYREATVKYFKLCRAREEVTRVEVEVRRLRTAIYDEEQEVEAAVELLMMTDPHLGLELKRQHGQRHAINMLHVRRLDKIESSVGYHGPKGVGTRRASTNSPELPRRDYAMRNQDIFQPSDELVYSEAAALEEDRIATELMADYLYGIGDD